MLFKITKSAKLIHPTDSRLLYSSPYSYQHQYSRGTARKDPPESSSSVNLELPLFHQGLDCYRAGLAPTHGLFLLPKNRTKDHKHVQDMYLVL